METIRQSLSGKNFMRSVMGVIGVVGGFALIFCCLFCHVPEENKEIKVQVLTFAIGLVVLIIGYYYTTSQGSSEKNDLLNQKP